MITVAFGSGYALLAIVALLAPRTWRRPAVLSPLISSLLVLHFSASSSVSSLAVGWMTLIPIFSSAALLIWNEHEKGKLLTVGAVGMLAAVWLTQSDLLLDSAAMLLSSGALALLWITRAPGRIALAGPRSLGLGAACFAALVALLPLPPVSLGIEPQLVAILLLIVTATTFCVLPLGGWFLAAFTHLGARTLSPWALIYLPSFFFVVTTTVLSLPLSAQNTLAVVLVPLATASAIWLTAGMIFRPSERYVRVMGADLSLAMAAFAAKPLLAISAATMLVLMHLAVIPILASPTNLNKRLRFCAWILLSGLPPAPSFWFRFLVIAVIWSVNSTAALGACIVAGVILPLALLAATSDGGESRETTPLANQLLPVGSLLFLAYLGFMPQAFLHQSFGLG